MGDSQTETNQERQRERRRKKKYLKKCLTLESYMGQENHFLLSPTSKSWQKLHSCSGVSPWYSELNASEGKERSMSNTMNIHVLDVGLGVSRSELLPDVRVQSRRRRLSKNPAEKLLSSYSLKEFMSLLADDSLKRFFALNLKRTQLSLVCVYSFVEVNETNW